MTLQEQVNQLVKQQMTEWDLANKNYSELHLVQTKNLTLNSDESVLIQFNPARAISSLAKIDPKSIAKRPCFLCKKNRPKEQKEIDFLGKYSILINPFPILPYHITIASKTHQQQELSENSIKDMLLLSQQLPEDIIFFNGATAGASAPDHLHFQAGKKTDFPQSLFEPCTTRTKIIFESKNIEELTLFISEKIRQQQEIAPDCFNLFCSWKKESWKIVFFERKKHRPTQFFEKKIMISPGAIDMAGILITTRNEDFQNINSKDIIDIFQQISINKN